MSSQEPCGLGKSPTAIPVPPELARDLKALKALLVLLRKQGVTEFDSFGTRIRLGDLPRPEGSAGDWGDDEREVDPFADGPAPHAADAIDLRGVLE